MKKLLTLVSLGLTLAMGVAHAAEETKKEPTAQQMKMKSCNKDAEGKKGDERKAFMKECLGGKAEAAAASPVCEKSAADKKLHGAAKNAHIKKCMADAAPAAAK